MQHNIIQSDMIHLYTLILLYIYIHFRLVFAEPAREDRVTFYCRILLLLADAQVLKAHILFRKATLTVSSWHKKGCMSGIC